MNVKPLAATLLCIVAGCSRKVEKPIGVEGHRDKEAVMVKLHNGTNVELVIQTFVRQGLDSYRMSSTYRLPTSIRSGPFDLSPDLEVRLFDALPIVTDRIGAYSIEICTDKTEVRYAVIDISKKEMVSAKELSRLVIAFKQNEVFVIVGSKQWRQPWLRPLPKRKAQGIGLAPRRLTS